MIKIINPDKVENLKDYCNSSKGKIILCYGFGKDYCPQTCAYAHDIRGVGIGAMTEGDIERIVQSYQGDKLISEAKE